MTSHLLTTEHVGHGITPPPPDGVPIVTMAIKKHPPDRRCFRYGSTPAAELRLLTPSIVGVPLDTSVVALHVFSACLCGGLAWRAPRTGDNRASGHGRVPHKRRTRLGCNPALGPWS